MSPIVDPTEINVNLGHYNLSRALAFILSLDQYQDRSLGFM